MSELPPLVLRRPVLDDVPFLTNSWLRSYRDSGAAIRHVPNDVYHLLHHRIIERLWRDEQVTWLVACYPQDTSFIYGWLCGENTDAGPVLHYVYVRRSMRKFGVATHLVNTFADGHDRGFMTHLTRGWEGLVSTLPTEFDYNPYFLYQEFRLPFTKKPGKVVA